jgi:arthrofactin-type cyclic lipopeptide synthetase C
MVSEAQQAGLQLDLATLFSTPVLCHLAGEIVQTQHPVDRVIPFRASGNQTPLFIVPEFSGELLYGPALTAAIEQNIPVYGLSAPDRMQPSLKTFQRMAARYVQMIRRTQPQGPYRLLGWSSGGVLAYEIAGQLIGQEQTVEFLGMLDSWLPGVIKQPEQSDEEMMLALSRGIVDYLAKQVLGHSLDLSETVHWQDCYRLAASLGCLPHGWSDVYFRQMLIHQKDFLSIDYQVLPLPVDVNLIAAQDSPDKIPYLGWDQVLSPEQIHLVTVPGGHYELVSTPYVTAVGSAISQAIAQRVKWSRQYPVVPTGSQSSPVMKLQEGQANQPVIVCIPGAGDNVFSFIEFAQSMTANWTVLAIQPRGLWRDEIPHSSVEAAAAFYGRALQSELTHREIHVLGHSFGGWVAMEMVSQMESQGISVKSLTIADSRVPGASSCREYTDVQVMRYLIDLFEMRGGSLGLTEEALASLSYSERLQRVLAGLIEQGLIPKNTRLHDFEGIVRVFATNIRTWYLPDRFPQVPVNLVMANGTSPDYLVGWKSILPDIETFQSQGNHMTLLKSPCVSLLVDIVQAK